MRILVTAASKHGATREIGEFIAMTLSEQGHAAVFEDMEPSLNISPYEAAVMGSAVYMGKWMKNARTYIEKHRKVLRTLPVWIFSSGPLGRQETSDQEHTVVINQIMQQTNARDHKVFSGKLDMDQLNVFERAVTHAVRAKEGDFRSWSEIAAWSITIADALHKQEQA